MSARTILIAGGGTGGHLMPALAIAQAIRERTPEFEPVLIGAERGVEARILPTRDFRFHLLPAEPIYRKTWWKNARWPFVGWRLLRATKKVLDVERPAAVIGTGGYASGPTVMLGRLRNIPSAVQEQNAYPGMATRVLSRHVDHVYLGLPEAGTRITVKRGAKVIETGNPIVPPTPERRAAAMQRFGLSPEGPGKPVLLVTGGSQGALAINRAVAQWLDAGGGREMILVWVTGRGTHAEFARYHRPPDVHVVDFLDPMADGYAIADLVVSRAGMITVAELCAWGLPGILIPLPTAAADHQTHNARVLADAGAAILLPQRELSADRLRAVITRMCTETSTREQMAARALARGRPYAAATIVSHLLTLAR